MHYVNKWCIRFFVYYYESRKKGCEISKNYKECLLGRDYFCKYKSRHEKQYEESTLFICRVGRHSE